jgi:quercetin dioxygenase-like cupin family protein
MSMSNVRWTASEVSVQLRKVLNSPSFRRAEKQAALFEHITLRTLNEEWSALSQKAIAYDLLRDASLTTIVGLRANRLRAALSRYYATEGIEDDLVFQLPVGSYVVRIEKRDHRIRGKEVVQPLAGDPGVSSEDFRQYVEQIAAIEGTAREDLNRRTQRWVSSSARFRGLRLALNREFESFFSLVRNEGGLRFQEMRSLARGLGIHPLMLDPLRSESVNEPYLVGILPAPNGQTATNRPIDIPPSHFFFQPVQSQPGEGSYGHGANYYFPSKALSGTDASFVWLRLDPGGSSDYHRHPGDEFLLVLRGRVIVDLSEPGLRFELSTASFTHFYAEQAHSVRNDSDEFAELLIIRFNERLGRETRLQMGVKLRDQIECGEGIRELSANLSAWILQTAGRPPRGSSLELNKRGNSDPVRNRLGLVRLLGRVLGTDRPSYLPR